MQTRPKFICITDARGNQLPFGEYLVWESGVRPEYVPIRRNWIFGPELVAAVLDVVFLPNPLLKIIASYYGTIEGTEWNVEVHMDPLASNLHICTKLHPNTFATEADREALRRVCAMRDTAECRHRIRTHTFKVPNLIS